MIYMSKLLTGERWEGRLAHCPPEATKKVAEKKAPAPAPEPPAPVEEVDVDVIDTKLQHVCP